MDLTGKLKEFSPKQTLADKLGEIIFSKRIETGITQEELAKKANVKPSIVHRIEAGSDISINEFEKVAHSLDITQSDILWAISTIS